MLTPAPPPGRRVLKSGARMFTLALAGIALPVIVHAAAVPLWTDQLVMAPGEISFGSGSMRVSNLEQPHIAFYKDSSGVRSLIYANRVAAGQWRIEYVLTTSDLAGPIAGVPHPGPFLGINDETDAPTIVYTRQAGAGPWGIWRATKSGPTTWSHLQIGVIAPPVQFDAAIDSGSVAHWFSLNQGNVADTLNHASIGAVPHNCTVVVTPGSNVLDPRWMAGATTEAGAALAFLLSDFDPFFGTSAVRIYSHPNGGLSLEAAFRSSPAMPPFMTPPVSASQNPFNGVSLSGGPTATLEGGGGSWIWNASNNHRVYALGPFGDTQDLSYVDFSPVIYSYAPNGPDWRTVITVADVFGTWAYSIEGDVSGAVGVPSISANGRLTTYLTAVEDFTASRLIRFRAYGDQVIGVEDELAKPAAISLRTWPQPARSGGEMWFAGFREDGLGQVDLYDVSGRRVATVEGTVRGGTMRAVAPRLGVGVYFARTGTLKGTRVVVAE